jgi:hypothetical protein
MSKKIDNEETYFPSSSIKRIMKISDEVNNVGLVSLL